MASVQGIELCTVLRKSNRAVLSLSYVDNELRWKLAGQIPRPTRRSLAKPRITDEEMAGV